MGRPVGLDVMALIAMAGISGIDAVLARELVMAADEGFRLALADRDDEGEDDGG